MAARPNTLRTLEYGKKLIDNQLSRLNDMIAMAETVLSENKTLTPGDIAGYKACIATGRKQITLLTRLSDMGLPSVDVTTSRKRGRPSKAELEQLAAARGERVAKPVVASAPAVLANAPKKRGRKSKAAIAAEAAAAMVQQVNAPKRRGRPPKAQPVIEAAEETKAPAKRRGRPPKVKSDAVVEMVQSDTDTRKRVGRKPKPVAPEINTAAIEEGAPVKRGPGRPKGSKNKVNVINGQNAEVVAA